MRIADVLVCPTREEDDCVRSMLMKITTAMKVTTAMIQCSTTSS